DQLAIRDAVTQQTERPHGVIQYRAVVRQRTHKQTLAGRRCLADALHVERGIEDRRTHCDVRAGTVDGRLPPRHVSDSAPEGARAEIIALQRRGVRTPRVEGDDAMIRRSLHRGWPQETVRTDIGAYPIDPRSQIELQ